ncbi:MAG: hypothetical protein U5L74_01465 [Ideonella sp.]|nr:hypothetical protein [Ideonella sp.]
MIELDDIQALILRAAGPTVVHQVLTVGQGRGGQAAAVLRALPCSFGVLSEQGNRCSIGFTFRGLQALGLPLGYQRVMHQRSPAFAQGAFARSAALGDTAESAASRWSPCFRPDVAHVLVSWHGESRWIAQQAQCLQDRWAALWGSVHWPPFEGQRLGAPIGEEGEWIHFGMRDGVTEVSCDDAHPRPTAPVLHQHALGALVLGLPNELGLNHYALPRSPRRVRAFFSGSSFGVFRPMRQDVVSFERLMDEWARDLPWPSRSSSFTSDIKAAKQRFLKAKLLGRWPDGSALRADAFSPPKQAANAQHWDLDLKHDPQGLGCPIGSHVRRMQFSPDDSGHVLPRPLQRRSLPYGPPFDPEGAPHQSIDRGLLGHFFCADLEDQFEHLLGQWATRPRLDMDEAEASKDPLIGHLESVEGTIRVPMKDKPELVLKGLMDWTQTIGMLYGWYPSKSALDALLTGDFVPEDEEGPWV